MDLYSFPHNDNLHCKEFLTLKTDMIISLKLITVLRRFVIG